MVGAFAGLAGYLVGRSVDDASGVPDAAVILPQSTSGGVERPAGSISAIAAGTLPAVVSILAEGTTQSGSGSGFVVRPNGYILTNNHVVDLVSDGGTLTVVFSDGDRATGTVVGTNSSYDLAVVKVDGASLPTVPIGSSAALNVGDAVIAVGSPLGLQGTVTTGIVSALNRPVTAGGAETGETAFINAIQTDAAINPGNSGGPLLDGTGAVIGVNSAIASLGASAGGQAGSIGLGFAIPIDTAKRIADEIISTGSSTTPVIGVSLDTSFAGPGAMIEEVTAGGAAEAAGLQGGDTITAIDGVAIEDSTALIVTVRSKAPGDAVSLSVLRGGQTIEVTLTLGSSTT